MKILLSCLFFLSATFAAPETSSLDGRIIGGEETTIQEYPYQVSVEYKNSHRCGGVIIARTWVLTAAHCVYELDSFYFRIRFGTTHRDIGGHVILANNVIPHANYSFTTFDFDIALLHLEQTITLSSKAQIVALPRGEVNIIEGTLANVTGWGLTAVDGFPSPELQVIQIPRISQSVCRDLYSDYTVTDRMFCAGPLEGGKDACDGDGGGPLVSNSVLLGLTSWGVSCAQASYPGVYTNVGAFRDWITEQTGI